MSASLRARIAALRARIAQDTLGGNESLRDAIDLIGELARRDSVELDQGDVAAIGSNTTGRIQNAADIVTNTASIATNTAAVALTARDSGGVGIGYFTFSGNVTAGDEIQVGDVTLGWDSPTSDVNASRGPAMEISLDEMQGAIRAAGLDFGVYLGNADNSLNFVANAAGTAGNYALAINTDTGGVITRSAAVMTGGRAAGTVQTWYSQYTVTAGDVTAMAGGGLNSEIVIARVPSMTSKPTICHVSIWDVTSGAQHSTITNLIFGWKPFDTLQNIWGLTLQDNGPVLQANDTIHIMGVS